MYVFTKKHKYEINLISLNQLIITAYYYQSLKSIVAFFLNIYIIYCFKNFLGLAESSAYKILLILLKCNHLRCFHSLILLLCSVNFFLYSSTHTLG